MAWQTIGHDKNKKLFNSIVKAGELSHAYLFWGQDMIGKKMFALELYALANKRSAILDTDADIKILFPKTEDGEAKIYIEDARNLKKFLSLRPNVGPYKFAIIDDADTLTVEASNAILKTLEEPRPNTVLILISSKPKFILQTIRSRCEAIKFNQIPNEIISEYLKQNKVKKDDVDFIIRVANGRLGWAINVVNRGSIDEIRKSIDELNKVARQGIVEKILFSKKLFEAGDYIEKLNNWMSYLHVDISLANNAKILRGLNKLYPIISEPSFNHRLAIENFFINID